MTGHLSDEQLLDYLDAALPEEQIRNAEAHLIHCKQCSAGLDAFRRIREQIQAPVAPRVFDNVENAVLDRIHKVNLLPAKKDYFIIKATALFALSLISLSCVVVFLSSSDAVNSGILQGLGTFESIAPPSFMPISRMLEKFIAGNGVQYLLNFIFVGSVLALEQTWVNRKRNFAQRQSQN